MRLPGAYKYLFDNRERLTTPIILSLLIHLMLFSAVISWTYFFAREKPKPEIVEVIPLEDDSVYQLADIEPPKVEKRPLKSKLAGMYDSTVEKETVFLTRKKIKGEGEGTKQGDGFIGEDKIKRDVFRSQLGNIVMKNTPGSYGMSSTIEDFFPDFHVGSKTYLNVKKFEDVSYFVRMSRVIRMTWNPFPSVKNALSLGKVNMVKIVTVVAVGIGETGELDELFVIKKSGIPEYDQEILRTMRASSPFVTPPKNFTEDDGKLRLLYSFICYL